MPELPEVETTRRGINPHLVDQTITDLTVRNHQLRWPVPANLRKLICGQIVRNLSRRGKYLLMAFDSGTLLIHLGMSGSLRLVEQPAPPPKKHDHIELKTANGLLLRYHDPRRFGCWLWCDGETGQHPLLAHLGPEPLSPAFNGRYLHARCQRSKMPVKSLLMDSSVVVGVGNIYTNEALFISHIRPMRPACTLSQVECRALAKAAKTVLAAAIRQGGTTLRDFVNGNGKPGYFAQQLKVYGRGKQPCLKCSTPLIETRLAQRTTVYCPQCQL